ncbi:MAG: DUF1453 family protein [Chloroflexi bacterium]|nr:DUF1453 family protein [Chloroflexota bacterium]
MKIITLSEPALLVAALLVVGILLVLQVRRRRLNVRVMWLVVATLAGVTAAVVSQNPPDASGWPWLLLAAVVGGLVGGTRGLFTDIRDVDPDARTLLVRTTWTGLLLWCAAFVGRVALRQIVGRSNPDNSTISLTTASLLVFALTNLLANTTVIDRALRQVRNDPRVTADNFTP